MNASEVLAGVKLIPMSEDPYRVYTAQVQEDPLEVFAGVVGAAEVEVQAEVEQPRHLDE